METSYPWDGTVRMTLGPKGAQKRELRVRIPGWCGCYSLCRNGKPVKTVVQDGYAVVKGKLREGDVFTLTMDMPARLEAADPRVKQDVGMRAVTRGPLVYCLEEVDNPGYDNAVISESSTLKCRQEPDLLGGVVTITAGDYKYVPYYGWDNRTAGRMRVWIPLNQ